MKAGPHPTSRKVHGFSLLATCIEAGLLPTSMEFGWWKLPWKLMEVD